MEKQKTICPYCKSKNQWYMHTNGDEHVYQCTECLRYFKIIAKEDKAVNN